VCVCVCVCVCVFVKEISTERCTRHGHVAGFVVTKNTYRTIHTLHLGRVVDKIFLPVFEYPGICLFRRVAKSWSRDFCSSYCLSVPPRKTRNAWIRTTLYIHTQVYCMAYWRHRYCYYFFRFVSRENVSVVSLSYRTRTKIHMKRADVQSTARDAARCKW